MAKRIKGACIIAPQINDENSKTYLDLLKLAGDRGIANLVYATYSQDGIAKTMDEEGYGRNKQFQHSAKDIWKFLNMDAFQNDQRQNLMKEARLLGSMNLRGELIDFTDAEEAYGKAKKYNDTHTGTVAAVYQHGDTYQIVLDKKDSRTIVKKADIERELAMWDELKRGLMEQGLSVDALKQSIPELTSPRKIQDLLNYIYRIQHAGIKSLSVQDIKTLLIIGEDTESVQSMEKRWGEDLDVVAKNIFDIVGEKEGAPKGNENFVKSTLNKIQDDSVLNIQKVKEAVERVGNEKLNIDEYNIPKTLAELNEKYNIGTDVITRTSDKINKLSEAVADIAISKQRQLDRLNKMQTIPDRALRTQKELEDTLTNLKGGMFYKSSLDFLADANKYIVEVNKLLDGIKNEESTLAYQANKAKVLTRAKNFIDAYSRIVESLSIADKLYIDEDLTKKDINNLCSIAKEVKSNIDSFKKVVNDITTDTLIDVFTDILGDTAYNGIAIADILSMAEADSTMFDYLYSLSRVSNPLIAGLDGIIRDANDKRDMLLNQCSDDIRRATKKFFDSGGKNTEFMYENGYIVSNIDWSEFYRKKYGYRHQLEDAGEKGVGLKIAMDAWEKNNTEEIVVDKESGRTERIPRLDLYHKQVVTEDSGGNQIVTIVDFQDGWTDAMKEYYATMMDIKGRIGTLLPEYAQHQYIAPQVTKLKREVLADMVKGKISVREGVKILLERITGKKRQDDIRYSSNGILVNGQDVTAYEGSFDNTPMRQIPIFYINRLDNQNELLKDFSSGLQHLAATVYNYATISEIRDIVELAADYIKNAEIAHATKLGKKAEEFVNGAGITVARALKTTSEATNTAALLTALVDRDIYGEKYKDQGRLGRILQNIIEYGTFKSLTFNVLGGVSNKLVGDVQSLIEGISGEYFDIANLARAKVLVAGNKLNVGKAWDFFTNSKNTLAGILEDYFDPIQETYGEKSRERYYRDPFSKMFGNFDHMILYSSGESMIHLTNMYAILCAEKVVDKNGNIYSLYDALTTKNKLDGTAELAVKDGFRRLDGSEINEDYLHSIKQTIRTVNQKTHGSMNGEDKGIIHRHVLGRAALNFRQWMVEHYSRRYRSLHFEAMAGNVLDRNFFLKTQVLVDGEKTALYNAFTRFDHADGTFSLALKDNVTKLNGEAITQEDIEEMRKKADADQHLNAGFYSDAFKWAKDFIHGIFNVEARSAAKWSSLSDRQKYNIKRCLLGEVPIILALFGFSQVLGDEDDHKGEWWYRFLMYQTKRLLMDEWASFPIGAIAESRKFIQRPIAATSTIEDLLYPITGLMPGLLSGDGWLPDVFKEQGSGRYKGENKYWYNIRRHTIPFWWDIQKLKYLDEDHTVFGIFDNTNYTR